MRIYVAGPLTAPPLGYIRNLATMCAVAIRLWRMGHVPFVPGLDFLLCFASAFSEPLSLAEVREWNMQWLTTCQGVYVIAHSPGVDAEVERAQQLGIPVWHSFEDVPAPEVAR